MQLPGGSRGEKGKRKAPPKKPVKKGKHEKEEPVKAARAQQMDTSTVTTAPVDAMVDTQADQSDADMEAWFSSGTGPANHYHPTAQVGETATTTTTTTEAA